MPTSGCFSTLTIESLTRRSKAGLREIRLREVCYVGGPNVRMRNAAICATGGVENPSFKLSCRLELSRTGHSAASTHEVGSPATRSFVT
jgi:hypothetical protein